MKKLDLIDLIGQMSSLIRQIGAAQDLGDTDLPPSMMRPLADLRALEGSPVGTFAEQVPAGPAGESPRIRFCRFAVPYHAIKGAWVSLHWKQRQKVIERLQAAIWAQVDRRGRRTSPVPRVVVARAFTRRPLGGRALEDAIQPVLDAMETTGLLWENSPIWVNLEASCRPAGHAAPHLEVEVWDAEEQIWSEAQRLEIEKARSRWSITDKAARRIRERSTAKKVRRGLLTRYESVATEEKQS